MKAFRVSFYKRVVFFACCLVFCFIAASFLLMLLGKIIGLTPTMLRISVILQNLIAMVLPATITAIIISNNPIRFLCLDKLPSMWQVILTILIMFFALPFMNLITAWNSSIHLPEQLSALEDIMRALEDAAAATTNALLSNTTIFSLIVTVLAVGIFTGFSEELLFRGTLQRILQSRPMNIHIAIWITAGIFSFIHFQFFGFIPRLLLGAYFGYLLYWSKSLLTPIIAHSINNSAVVISAYFYNDSDSESVIDMIGVGADNSITIISIASLIITIILLYAFYKSQTDKSSI